MAKGMVMADRIKAAELNILFSRGADSTPEMKREIFCLISNMPKPLALTGLNVTNNFSPARWQKRCTNDS